MGHQTLSMRQHRVLEQQLHFKMNLVLHKIQAIFVQGMFYV